MVLQVIGFATMGVSGYRPRGEEAVAIFTAAPERILAGELVGGSYSLVFLLVFVGCVAGAIWEQAKDARLAAIALAGGVTLTVALAIGYRVLNAGAFQAGGSDGISPELATTLYRLYTSSFAGFASFGLAALLGATGLAALRSGMLPEWLGWTSVGAAVGLMTPAHFIFEGLALVWIVAVSLVLYRTRAGRPSDAAIAA